ncbi:biosynthetic arginine decarboxylase [Tichowtungia aerotolerans]|uniref:Biosynthetic arginine decarboxylase n=1 Tax=Tichowtungia aerotolerans TaxID=2697043 RepID=A0A6P1MCK9_9BACT|nr:biosynthetic arginine decarboxylase [Tichowtungia aerotolerans]QHI69336.1 biosynthetic arginine decarboxylase [Tichowtungia aerotolerans]
MKSLQSGWSSAKAAEVYGVERWGAGYFSVSETGEVVVHPSGNGASVSLQEISQGIQERGFDLPVLVRISDILDARIKNLHESFGAAIQEYGYSGCYRGVYPIKVNQQQQVVEEICNFGAHYHHGLEAGSKAELIAAMSFLQDSGAYLVCNGYKDEEFVDLGLYTLKMGIRCVFVIEMPSELDLILERSKKLGVRPILGVRMKLSTQASGHWTESGGERSVFGLNTAQVMDAVDRLREEEMLDCLHLLHYHLGSQIPNIRDIREAVKEGCRIYAGLVNEGAAMGALDLGGGLAVDYDGSHTDFTSSCNYGTAEYCSAIVEEIMSILDETGTPHPDIVTESGRATVAYYSVLLFNVLDVSRFETHDLPETLPEDAHELLGNLMETLNALSVEKVQECYHDAVYYRDEAHELFKRGGITLRERGVAGQIFWHILRRISVLLKDLDYVPDEFEHLPAALADVYYGNFSLFQSLPDSWAIDQLFPILPIHRLNEEPTHEAILADITCDCDGKIDRFIDLHDVRRTLPVHDLRDDEDYTLGVFLVGAYQETLGDLHNLLGDTNVVSVQIDEDGHIHYSREIEGDSVADVLSYVEYEPKEMVRRVRAMAERAVKSGRISPKERRAVMDAYESGLRGYTYFEREN